VYFISDRVVDLIGLEVARGGIPVFEANPGLGFISRGLLAAGVKRLFLCEPTLSLSQHLKVKLLLSKGIRIFQKVIVLQLAKFPALLGS
jgi:hypothetical protein